MKLSPGLNSQAQTTAGAPVALVLMPYAMMRFPSLGLGVLKAAVRARGIGCQVEYANIRFDEEIGHSMYSALSRAAQESQLAEWTFGAAAFPDFDPDPQPYFALYQRVIRTAAYELFMAGDDGFRERLPQVRSLATGFVDRLARRLVSAKVKIVGCSSNYQQHVASLALLRRVKELDPGVITVLGGVNCSGSQGRATHASFPWLDVVFTAEADQAFPELCAQALEGKSLEEIVPVLGPAVLGPGDRDRAPRLAVPGAGQDHFDLGAAATPDFDDFFTTLASSKYANSVNVTLPVEGARGCWWGDKHQCSFCGINATTPFRSKPGARLAAELEQLSRRHGVRTFAMSDQIFDMAYLKTLFPLLAGMGRPYHLFSMCKSNLKREQFQLLGEAGVRWLQVGIESLHDRALAALNKGSTTAQNLQAMKWCLEYGIVCSWSLLVRFPDEDDAWNLEMARWLPWVFHLEPPGNVLPVMLYRYSPYQREGEKYGLKVVPARGYRHVYPVDEAVLPELAYFFEDAQQGAAPTVGPGHAELLRLVHNWQVGHAAANRPVLRLEDHGDHLQIEDTRVVATARHHTLEGHCAQVLRRCDRAQAREPLRAELGLTAGELDEAVGRLVRDRLLLELSGRLLSLPVGRELFPRPADSENPWGFVG